MNEMRLHDLDDDHPRDRLPGRAAGILTEAIDDGLGRIDMAATGVLTAVDLDERTMRAMRADAVAGHLVAAIGRAQDKARHAAVSGMWR